MNVDMPRGMRDEDWILFAGRIGNQDAHEVHLVPAEDDDISIVHSKQDVHTTTDSAQNTWIFVRKGARYVRFVVGRYSNYSTRSVRGDRCSHNCSGSCQCVGQVEYCCNGGVAVGSCYGEWACQNP